MNDPDEFQRHVCRESCRTGRSVWKVVDGVRTRQWVAVDCRHNFPKTPSAVFVLLVFVVVVVLGSSIH